MKLFICFGICLSSKWVHLRLTFFLFSNLGLIIIRQTSIHIDYFTPGGWHTLCRPISKMHIVGEGPGETPSALRCLSYLINNFLSWEGLRAGGEGTTEDEMTGWHHWLDGRESEWTPGVVDGQGGLACCNSWGRKNLDMTERLNWTELRSRLITITKSTLHSN